MNKDRSEINHGSHGTTRIKTACSSGFIRGQKIRRSKNKGFTLVELLLVLVILGILAAIVVPKFGGRTEQARQTAAVTTIASFKTALDAFEVDTGTYPRGADGLQQLTFPQSSPPPDVTNYRGPYLSSDVPADPWGHPYTYVYPGQINQGSYDIISGGPDGQIGTEDDVVNQGIRGK